ncbi:site-specific integrase [Chromobacterium sp. S0633]|uniref:site-specific integrase n=1 Tax=Chromobacterium sp. S0633 TaxID=2957805 RepID=UPI00209F9B87|nr:site-specific integrase [Chromobacterium sp. S0633]MCP1290345.1 site-specific integrase [Chromobacterium sp. S0633]
MQGLNQAPLPFDDVVMGVVRMLPPLPPVLRYYDDFDDVTRTILHPESASIFETIVQGTRYLLDFSSQDTSHALLLKQVFAFLLGSELSPMTVARYLQSAKQIERYELEELLACGPQGVGFAWERLRGRELPPVAYLFVKALLRMLSEYRLQGWSSDYNALLSSTLPLPIQDKYAGVRSGEVFLRIDEEAEIVRFLDEIADRVTRKPNSLTLAELNDTAMLMCSYQFGMRPLQIASVRHRDIRIWNGDSADIQAVHITFSMIKQKTITNSRPLTRKVKHEWSILIRELYSKRHESGAGGNDRLFSMDSGHEASRRISELLAKLIPGGATATDLRHTAAQRLVDAGASQEELAEFLGHSDITTGLVYYATSANQAERVNKALGLSSIYSRVAKIAHEKFISSAELASLKEDQQIAGVPHGIPIAGIGGCASGQPLCPSNPILACYGCHKFMPIHEIGIHEQVLSDFRNIVRFFYDSSRGDKNSPAYLQLQRTISSVEAIIEELREGAQ